MDNISMNHYEKQLYTVFKTFDVDNREALDKCAVLDLCDALQLEDRGTALVDTLFERRAGRVTFAQFRNGLLSVLGASETPAPHNTSPSNVLPTHSMQDASRQTQSDDDSSGREVAPKFVRGSKKYGRRSRPQRSSLPEDQHSPRAASESRLEAKCSQSNDYNNYKRSTSLVEHCSEVSTNNGLMSAKLDHDRKINCEQAFNLCRDLRMDGIDRRLIEQIFEESPDSETTVGVFFDRLNMSLTSSIATAGDGASMGVDNNDDEISCELVVETWEHAGVRRPRRLLAELGFTASTVRPPDLERALDAELRALAVQPDESPDVRSLLLQAALALGRLRLEQARNLVRATSAERDKLRADLVGANHRAQLLAQDVDENHARIEAELKANLKQLENRQAEAMRVAAAEWATERERLVAAHAGLEVEISRRADTETKLREELEALNKTNEDFLRRISICEERTAAAEKERARLTLALQEAAKPNGSESGASPSNTVDMAVLLDELSLENKLLRDRNDELCAELEAKARRTLSDDTPPICTAGNGSSWRDEAAACGSTSVHDHIEDSDSLIVGVEQKLLRQIDVGKRIQEMLDSTVESQSQSAADCAWSRSRELGEVLGANTAPAPRRVGDAAVQTEPPPDSPADLQAHAEEKRQLEESVKELETSLERMKIEYDKCEDYWSGKLHEERELHDEEQRLADERLAELVAKIGEYERQFAPRALSPIDERRALETQVTDLQEEFERYRRHAERELAERRAELERQAAHAASPPASCGACAALAARCGALGAARAAAAREAGALRARLARAEGAASQLNARLAVADLLVKELYVENCQLAHHQRAP